MFAKYQKKDYNNYRKLKLKKKIQKKEKKMIKYF